jgi:hypothetical protein
MRSALDVITAITRGETITADEALRLERHVRADEREACAALAESFLDGKTDNISCIQANALDKVAFAIRNRK